MASGLKESEGGQAVVNKNFEHKFPDMLIIEAKDEYEFQKQVEMPSYPALLRGFMEDWNCYGSTKNGEVNKREWTLQKICEEILSTASISSAVWTRMALT